MVATPPRLSPDGARNGRPDKPPKAAPLDYHIAASTPPRTTRVRKGQKR